MRDFLASQAQAVDEPVLGWREQVSRAWRRGWLWLGFGSRDRCLAWAVAHWQFAWAGELLKRGADINFAPVADPELAQGYSLRQDRTRKTALHRACIRGDFRAAAWLLANGAAARLHDTWGTVPMQLAAERGHLHIVALLAGHGESLDSYMPVYSTYAEEFLPSTVDEYVRRKGFKGDEHLRYMAGISSSQMQGLTHHGPGAADQAVVRQRL